MNGFLAWWGGDGKGRWIFRLVGLAFPWYWMLDDSWLAQAPRGAEAKPEVPDKGPLYLMTLGKVSRSFTYWSWCCCSVRSCPPEMAALLVGFGCLTPMASWACMSCVVVVTRAVSGDILIYISMYPDCQVCILPMVAGRIWQGSKLQIVRSFGLETPCTCAQRRIISYKAMRACMQYDSISSLEHPVYAPTRGYSTHRLDLHCIQGPECNEGLSTGIQCPRGLFASA
ncbi:hypothetical protein N656DRAFT_514190 [Canariomyces notabilis]|uniref:Uncharacterized protein n=1 Tax=Canariomyces notabilis TaxID=2074819 RepID=A0AAN6QD26_9PEZI|nr:hypothetical protein N656DRAFT_514190 [Canariomyces arenarius]